ncbi:hypothetical protein [Paenibacillus sp. MMS20-IR301]|uniref:hypothetical protein n=1 Tax=Paenibacillus sp. MMS20-IR301 TaxID=2895946 RepID=UPI0028E25BBA|nr:hypothetical protein [Paenibacillus sp. MMS20-IR301]WNS43448.1 hypothetical protein LOS79_31680 [Paenibacillus sp. MMS20-IR301]
MNAKLETKVNRGLRMLILVLSIGLCLLAAGCGMTESSAPERARILTQEEVTAVFADEDLLLLEGEEVPGAVFQLELNGVKPQLYVLNGVELPIYQFSSAEERAAGWKAFGEQTATADLVPYQAYQEDSILMFYVHGESVQEGLKWNGQLDRQLKAAVQGLVAAQ